MGGGCPSSVSSVSLRTLLPEVDSTSEVKIDETESRDYPPKSHGLSPKKMLFYGYPPVSDTTHITPWSSADGASTPQSLGTTPFTWIAWAVSYSLAQLVIVTGCWFTDKCNHEM